MQNRVIVSSSFFLEDSGWVGGWMLVCYPKREQAKLTLEVNLEVTCVVSSISFSFRVDALSR